ncbi:MAG: NADH-quinone oxidoreductase subunit NuoE [Alphaproteobacteria bacterium]|nr:NADH-quinone oxidoreductase subunit NuoE [Alphaproteobacteria bacterium]
MWESPWKQYREEITVSNPPKDFKIFEFSKENKAKIELILKRYPEGRQASAILPLFDLAQRQCGGWLPPSAIEKVTEILGVSLVRGYEVATFYTMFNLTPVGQYHVQICGTTPCMLRGSEDLKRVCKKHLGIAEGETTEDGLFTVNEVECIGACVNAPAVQINDDYFEDLTKETFLNLLEDLKGGKDIKPGSAVGRQGSAPLEPPHERHPREGGEPGDA